MSNFGKIATLLYSVFGIPIGLLTIKELSRLLVFVIQIGLILFTQHQSGESTWKVIILFFILPFCFEIKWYLVSKLCYNFFLFDINLQVLRGLESYAESISHKFSQRMAIDTHQTKEKENEWINRQLATEEEKYYEDTIESSIPFSIASLLFFVFFVISSALYCIVFMWKNPLDGFFFTGMLYTTIEDADTVSKKVSKFFTTSLVFNTYLWFFVRSVN